MADDERPWHVKSYGFTKDGHTILAAPQKQAPQRVRLNRKGESTMHDTYHVSMKDAADFAFRK